MLQSLDLFRLDGKVSVIIGGGGVLGAAMAGGLAGAGSKVVVADQRLDCAREVVEKLLQGGYEAVALECDALSRSSLKTCCRIILERFGRIDVLVSAAGGNSPSATTSAEMSFFDIPREGLEQVMELNIMAGAILPAQEFGREMVKNDQGGSIIFISSMTAFRPLTKVCAYSAAKAAVSNFTQWLAVYMAQNYSTSLRVNALAPGFFSTRQNQFLLFQEDGKTLTDRGRLILEHTPMKRFGLSEDLVGALVWLASPASAFVTGIVTPVDGGFSAFSGV